MAVIILREYVVISGVALATAAFYVTDLAEMLRPADQRGSDRVIPHGGVIAKPRRRTVSKRALPLAIHGDRDQNGAVVSDYRAGLGAHIAYLNANIVAPSFTGDGTRAATLVLASGNRSAQVHVEGMDIGSGKGGMVRATLNLSFPYGEFF
jgi:hypothetical protein